MIPILLGFIAGFGIPLQTSVNSKLRERLSSPFVASLVSFLVALVFLIALLLFTGGNLSYPMDKLVKEPFWIWLGGLCGIIYLTGNILLFGKLGSVETVVMPVLGQILMGLLIDHFGLFYSHVVPLGALRLAGALLVISGVALVAVAKKGNRNETGRNGGDIWIWRFFGIGIGMLLAIQTATNGYLGKIVESPVKASIVSFATGSVIITVLCTLKREWGKGKGNKGSYPFWIWLGGIQGVIYNLANVYLSRIIGTGMTVVLLLVGTSTGGLLVDHFALLGTPKNPINVKKLSGMALMVLGAALIKLF